MKRELVTVQNLANLIGVTKRAVQKHITAFAQERIANRREQSVKRWEKIVAQSRLKS